MRATVDRENSTSAAACDTVQRRGQWAICDFNTFTLAMQNGKDLMFGTEDEAAAFIEECEPLRNRNVFPIEMVN